MRDADECRLAVGFFDGVHLGHRAILDGADAALTFSRHPLAVLSPERAPVLLMTVEERVAAIRACGVGEVTVFDFTPELAQMQPEDFERTLRARAAGRKLVVRCGENWRFGCGGRGNADFLRARGIGVEVVPYAAFRGEPISSSRIRRCLADGAVAEAAELLGRPYEVRGDVLPGKGLGSQLGFPTLNVRPDRPLNLRRGVYAVRVAGVRGIANYGLAPTLGDRAWAEPMLEVHLLDATRFEGDSPTQPVAERVPPGCAVEIFAFIREERRFASLDELKRQIAADCRYMARITNHESRTTNHESRTTNHEIQGQHSHRAVGT